jgi:site-specific DNA recombinase
LAWRPCLDAPRKGATTTTPERKIFRCAIYTRKSTERNLDLTFNSRDAQREACEASIKSQAHEDWRLVPDRYDDGGLSGASIDRPALQNLLADVGAARITIVVVYTVDRLTHSFADFAKLDLLRKTGEACFPFFELGGAEEVERQLRRTGL